MVHSASKKVAAHDGDEERGSPPWLTDATKVSANRATSIDAGDDVQTGADALPARVPPGSELSEGLVTVVAVAMVVVVVVVDVSAR